MAEDTPPFRFMDMPREIRGEVYSHLLLRDEPTLTFVEHSIDTAILRTNSQIHREAYDVMVKSNQFIRLNCVMYMPFLEGFAGHGMPTMACGPVVEQFKGHVLAVTVFIETDTHALDEECQEISIMMMGSGLERFCRSLAFLLRNTQECATSLDIEVGPICFENHVHYKNDMTGYFSETIQKVLESLESKKDEGLGFYRKGDFMQASMLWAEVSMEVASLRRGKSWDKIQRISGDSFIERIADLQFKMALNVAQATIKVRYMTYSMLGKSRSNPELQRDMAECGLKMSADAAAPGYWRDGYTWKYSDVLRAKLLYRRTMCVRMWGTIDEAEDAHMFLGKALELVPDDPVMLQEKENLMKWFLGE
ncbi:hypothetical protein COCMIDRAFT_2200 [Bipolaris oryzae ATCC 44560]|uniref:Uncharacterized protein n=1 Tax=Bipolaris oryzae ATCC 44560 TaxID=930090 RepID=W6ZFX5_COCMI|nr:uncharacterized protein COCMIDRAFT_2200 [Bipolaris oryzae ATCC 44560]EUC48935.1 hypothetical protein COCMIDRAFT_2200 [Bipolaris oryzae ATCC 44560]